MTRAPAACLVIPTALAALLLLVGCRETPPPSEPATGAGAPRVLPRSLVGREACLPCHRRETELYSGSPHDLAMEEATARSVRGDFGSNSHGATFDYAGVTTTFFRRGEEFWVRTDGAEGELRDFRVAYTFGDSPLQQILLETERGRLQALAIAWDTRPAAAGGQRWFHLYPNEAIDHRDPLHWTGRYLNWNSMCADCHSTGLDKGYRLDQDRFATTWKEIDVSCEACHGPASAHLTWAALDPEARAADPSAGLALSLRDSDDDEWSFSDASPNAARDTPRTAHVELETCAPCHSLRTEIGSAAEPGGSLFDRYRPSTLDARVYFDDGQIKEEVYEYGSFLQSRMFAHGVTCKDCHDPHTARLRIEDTATPDQVCSRCHQPAFYAATSHHHHRPGAPGSSCVGCHMPSRPYMIVDPRRDHSLRVPRPDLTSKIGSPNACDGCHQDRGPSWAAAAIERWFPGGRWQETHWGEALHAARSRTRDAESRLIEAFERPTTPGIARATMLLELRRLDSQATLAVVDTALGSSDPMLRIAAVRALEGADPAARMNRVATLLGDQVLAVRLAAARQLAGVAESDLDVASAAALETTLDELRRSLADNAERPEAQVELGTVAALTGDLDEAIARYQTALRLDPTTEVAAANLADLYRQQGLEGDAEGVLVSGLGHAPGSAPLHHALGLSRVRQRRLPEALESLERAAGLDPGEPRYAFVLAVALYDAGQQHLARDLLARNLDRDPSDRSSLAALAAWAASKAEREVVLGYARKRLDIEPQDPETLALVRQLEASRSP